MTSPNTITFDINKPYVDEITTQTWYPLRDTDIPSRHPITHHGFEDVVVDRQIVYMTSSIFTMRAKPDKHKAYALYCVRQTFRNNAPAWRLELLATKITQNEPDNDCDDLLLKIAAIVKLEMADLFNGQGPVLGRWCQCLSLTCLTRKAFLPENLEHHKALLESWRSKEAPPDLFR